MMAGRQHTQKLASSVVATTISSEIVLPRIRKCRAPAQTGPRHRRERRTKEAHPVAGTMEGGRTKEKNENTTRECWTTLIPTHITGGATNKAVGLQR
jgi:hypothetical protein